MKISRYKMLAATVLAIMTLIWGASALALGESVGDYNVLLMEIHDSEVQGSYIYIFNTQGPVNLLPNYEIYRNNINFVIKVKPAGATDFASLEEAGGSSVMTNSAGDAFVCDIHDENEVGKRLVCRFQMVATPLEIKNMIFKIEGFLPPMYGGMGVPMWSSPELRFKNCSLFDDIQCDEVGRNLCDRFTILLIDIANDPSMEGRYAFQFNALGPRSPMFGQGENLNFEILVQLPGSTDFKKLEEAGGAAIVKDANGNLILCDIHPENPKDKELLCRFQIVADPQHLDQMAFRIIGGTYGLPPWKSPTLYFTDCSLADSVRCNSVGRNVCTCAGDEPCLSGNMAAQVAQGSIAVGQMAQAGRPSLNANQMQRFADQLEKPINRQGPIEIEKKGEAPVGPEFDKSTELYDAQAQGEGLETQGGACTIAAQIPSSMVPYVMWAFALASVVAIRRRK